MVTIIYKLSVTNLECVVWLTENTDINSNKFNYFYLPMSLWVENTSIEKRKDEGIGDFIFSNNASINYDT